MKNSKQYFEDAKQIINNRGAHKSSAECQVWLMSITIILGAVRDAIREEGLPELTMRRVLKKVGNVFMEPIDNQAK
jgi:hypothetical protein